MKLQINQVYAPANYLPAGRKRSTLTFKSGLPGTVSTVSAFNKKLPDIKGQANVASSEGGRRARDAST